MSLFDEIRKNHKDYSPTNSMAWFKQNVTAAMNNLGTQQFLGKNLDLQTRSISPGNLCLFGYDPKTKDELPFYDNFPLLLPFGVDGKGFIGLNLHYLAPQYRIAIMDKLLHFSRNTMIPEKVKQQMSWQLLKRVATQRVAQHAVKRYLNGYVKTSFVVVPTKDWVIAAHLPLARFRKVSEQAVWGKM